MAYLMRPALFPCPSLASGLHRHAATEKDGQVSDEYLLHFTAFRSLVQL